MFPLLSIYSDEICIFVMGIFSHSLPQIIKYPIIKFCNVNFCDRNDIHHKLRHRLC